MTIISVVVLMVVTAYHCPAQPSIRFRRPAVLPPKSVAAEVWSTLPRRPWLPRSRRVGQAARRPAERAV